MSTRVSQYFSLNNFTVEVDAHDHEYHTLQLSEKLGDSYCLIAKFEQLCAIHRAIDAYIKKETAQIEAAKVNYTPDQIIPQPEVQSNVHERL